MFHIKASWRACRGCCNHVSTAFRTSIDLPNYESRLSRHTAVVRLVVGKNKTKLTCHRVLLSFYSKYCEVAFSTKSGHDDIIDLPGFNAHDMKGLIAWVYSGVVNVEMRNPCRL